MSFTKKHNKFAPVRTSFGRIEEISIEDEESVIKDLLETDRGKSSKMVKREGERGFDFLKRIGLDPIPFTTTQGNFDPDYVNWYVILDKDEGFIIIVYRGQENGKGGI